MDAPPEPIPPGRHPAALAVAIFQAWRPYRWRGYATGLVAGILAGGILAPLITTTLTLLGALAGIVDRVSGPWEAVLWTVTFALSAPFAGAIAYARWQPRDLRDAAESYLWLVQESEARWRDITGRATVPRDEAGMREFLRTAAPTPENAGERFGMWIALLDVTQARAAIKEMPRETPGDRFGHASAAWLAAFVAGDATEPSLEDIEALAEAIDGADDHREALVTVAVQRARAALVAGADWRAPLAAVRPGLGRAPDAIYARVVWRPAFRQLLIACVGGTVVYWVAWFLLEPYYRLPADALRWAYAITE
jgi:hypothetical protein